MQIDLSWPVITAVATAFTLGGSGMGWIIYNAKKQIRKLAMADQLSASSKLASQAKEESELRESLLNRYREMYQLEKDRGDRDRAELRHEMAELRQEFGVLTEKYDQLEADHERIITLNVNLQAENARLKHP
jgi:hypothetical protein